MQKFATLRGGLIAVSAAMVLSLSPLDAADEPGATGAAGATATGAAGATGAATAGAISGMQLNPAALIYSSPDKLPWRDPSGVSGVNQAVLHGDPTKPGLYVVLNRFKPGNFSRPHFHPNDRFITVVKGTWWVATGNKFDPNLTVPMPTGSFVTHFAKQVHWDGAKDDEAWVLIVGEGPATITLVEEAK